MSDKHTWGDKDTLRWTEGERLNKEKRFIVKVWHKKIRRLRQRQQHKTLAIFEKLKWTDDKEWKRKRTLGYLDDKLKITSTAK